MATWVLTQHHTQLDPTEKNRLSTKKCLIKEGLSFMTCKQAHGKLIHAPVYCHYQQTEIQPKCISSKPIIVV